MAHHRKIIYLASFLFALPVAITTYINSSFLETYMATYRVGLVYIISSILTIFGLSLMPRLLTRIGARLMSLYLSIAILLSFVVLAFAGNAPLVILAFVVNFTS